MKLVLSGVVLCLAVCGCCHFDRGCCAVCDHAHEPGQAYLSQSAASNGTAVGHGSPSAADSKTFDEYLTDAIQTHGRYLVIELRVLDPPRGSGQRELFDEVQRLRQSAGVPDGHGEIEKGVGRFVIAPLADMQFLAARIEFGTIISLDQQRRIVTVRWEFD